MGREGSGLLVGLLLGLGLGVDEAGLLRGVGGLEPDLGVGAGVPRAGGRVKLHGVLVALDLEALGSRAVLERSGRVGAVLALGLLVGLLVGLLLGLLLGGGRLGDGLGSSSGLGGLRSGTGALGSRGLVLGGVATGRLDGGLLGVTGQELALPLGEGL